MTDQTTSDTTDPDFWGKRQQAATVAGLREEWIVIYDHKEADGPTTFTVNQSKDSSDQPLTRHTARLLARNKMRDGHTNVRIVYRYVTDMKEIK